MSVRDILELIGIVGAAAAAIGAAYAVWRRLHDVHTAIMGEPPRTVAGVELPAVPAMGERLAAVEQRQAAQVAVVARIEAELHPNCGSSLRDAVDGAVDRLDRIEARLGPDRATKE